MLFRRSGWRLPGLASAARNPMTEQAYSPEVWRRFRAPTHAGCLEGPGAAQGLARTPASNAVLSLSVTVEQGRINAARFKALGCPSTIAAGEWLCEWLEGRAASEVTGFSSAMLEQALALSPVRRYCAIMAEDALAAAMKHLAA